MGQRGWLERTTTDSFDKWEEHDHSLLSRAYFFDKNSERQEYKRALPCCDHNNTIILDNSFVGVVNARMIEKFMVTYNDTVKKS